MSSSSNTPQRLEQQLASEKYAQQKRDAKLRFFGALLLLLGALATLPFVLSAPPRPAPVLKVQIASDAADNAASTPSEATPPASVQATLPTTPEPPPTPTPPPAVVATAAAPSALPSAASNHTQKRAKFVVQVGSFSDPERLKAVRDKLTKAKMPHHIEKATDRHGETRMRVRLSGFETEAEANAAAEKAKHLGLEARVFKL